MLVLSLLMRCNWIQTQGQTLSFYILRHSMVQEELRVLWPTLLLFKTRFISTGITEGKHCLTHKLHSRHDSCILITSYFNSRTLLNPTKIWAVNMKMTQHAMCLSLCSYQSTLLSLHALLVPLRVMASSPLITPQIIGVSNTLAGMQRCNLAWVISAD